MCPLFSYDFNAHFVRLLQQKNYLCRADRWKKKTIFRARMNYVWWPRAGLKMCFLLKTMLMGWRFSQNVFLYVRSSCTLTGSSNSAVSSWFPLLRFINSCVSKGTQWTGWFWDSIFVCQDQDLQHPSAVLLATSGSHAAQFDARFVATEAHSPANNVLTHWPFRLWSRLMWTKQVPVYEPLDLDFISTKQSSFVIVSAYEHTKDSCNNPWGGEIYDRSITWPTSSCIFQHHPYPIRMWAYVHILLVLNIEGRGSPSFKPTYWRLHKVRRRSILLCCM